METCIIMAHYGNPQFFETITTKIYIYASIASQISALRMKFSGHMHIKLKSGKMTVTIPGYFSTTICMAIHRKCLPAHWNDFIYKQLQKSRLSPYIFRRCFFLLQNVLSCERVVTYFMLIPLRFYAVMRS